MQLTDAEFQRLIGTEHAPLINVGTGEDVTIRELAELVARELGFGGGLHFDTSKPDGTPRKLLDVQKSMHWAGARRRAARRDSEDIRRGGAAAQARSAALTIPDTAEDTDAQQ